MKKRDYYNYISNSNRSVKLANCDENSKYYKINIHSN